MTPGMRQFNHTLHAEVVYDGRATAQNVIIPAGNTNPVEILIDLDAIGIDPAKSDAGTITVNVWAVQAQGSIYMGSDTVRANINVKQDLTSIREVSPKNKKHGILVEKNPITGDFAEILVKTPEATQINIFVYDNTGNVANYTVKTGDEFGLVNLASTVANLLDIEPYREWLPSIIEIKS
jgi:hypothetical protein